MRGSVGGFELEPEWGGSHSAWGHAPGVYALAKEVDPEDEPADEEFDDDDLDEGELGEDLEEDDLDLDDDDLDDDDLEDDDLDEDDLVDDDLIDLDDEYDNVDDVDRGPTAPRRYED